jgi:hypothetical protein
MLLAFAPSSVWEEEQSDGWQSVWDSVAGTVSRLQTLYIVAAPDIVCTSAITDIIYTPAGISTSTYCITVY